MPDKKKESAKKQKETKVAKQAEPEAKTSEIASKELQVQLQRALADFQNYKRRAEEEKTEFLRFANASLVKKILPVIDNFERAKKDLPEKLTEESWAKGILSTLDQLNKIMAEIGLTKFISEGTEFDPEKHEAVMTVADKKVKNNEIVKVFEEGYEYNGVLLRPAKVKVVNNS